MALAIAFKLWRQKIENQNIIKKLYSVIEVSKMLGIGKAKVFELINGGYLPAMNLGGMKVRKETIDEFLTKYEGYDLTDINNIVMIKL